MKPKRNNKGQFIKGQRAWNRTAPELTCLICHSPHYAPPAKLKVGKGKFCSRKCYAQYRRENKMLPPSQKGIPSWNKGLPAPWVTGENNHNWAGGVTTQNEKIRKSREYSLWRLAVLIRDEYICQSCGENDIKVLEVDHIKPFSLYPDLRLAIDNGRTLCVACHKKTNTWGRKVYNYAR